MHKQGLLYNFNKAVITEIQIWPLSTLYAPLLALFDINMYSVTIRN